MTAAPQLVTGVEQILELGGAPLRARMARVERRLAEVASDGGDDALASHAAATIAAGGKRLRPLLVFVAGLGGDDDAQLVRAAVAVELVHSATLVHDDVLDAAALRRGSPTVVAVGGRAMATATGDLLFARAFAELTRNASAAQLGALSAASSALARGELLQREDAWEAAVSEARYRERCELKTARLFQAACELGATAADGDDAALAGELGAFGRRVGLAFQLLDDVLDVSGPAHRTGKHRGTDLLDGTVTLPLILARRADRELAALDLRSIGTPEAAAAVCARIEATGALDVARRQALELAAEARSALPAALPERQRQALELVASGVVERYA